MYVYVYAYKLYLVTGRLMPWDADPACRSCSHYEIGVRQTGPVELTHDTPIDADVPSQLCGRGDEAVAMLNA